VITIGIDKQFSQAMGKARKNANDDKLITIAKRGKNGQRSDAPIA
jgi:hypothetical protein